jgi:hypothetical protein
MNTFLMIGILDPLGSATQRGQFDGIWFAVFWDAGEANNK